MGDEDRFDYLRERTPEQDEAADDVEPHVEDANPGVRGEDVDGERARTAQPGL